MTRVDTDELRAKVKAMYKAVAEAPDGEFHFEMGRALAERLGYPAAELDRVPQEAIESFAGVGYHLGLAAIAPGERVVDLGQWLGDGRVPRRATGGPGGEVVGVDMTDEQLAKARASGGPRRLLRPCASSRDTSRTRRWPTDRRTS